MADAMAVVRLDDPKLRQAAVNALFQERTIISRFPQSAVETRPCRKWQKAAWRPGQAGWGTEEDRRLAGAPLKRPLLEQKGLMAWGPGGLGEDLRLATQSLLVPKEQLDAKMEAFMKKNQPPEEKPRAAKTLEVVDLCDDEPPKAPTSQSAQTGALRPKTAAEETRSYTVSGHTRALDSEQKVPGGLPLWGSTTSLTLDERNLRERTSWDPAALPPQGPAPVVEDWRVDPRKPPVVDLEMPILSEEEKRALAEERKQQHERDRAKGATRGIMFPEHMAVHRVPWEDSLQSSFSRRDSKILKWMNQSNPLSSQAL